MDNNALKNAQKALRIQSVNIRNSSLNTRSDIVLSDLAASGNHTQSFHGVSLVEQYENEDKGGSGSRWKYRFHYTLGVRLASKDEQDKNLESDNEPLFQIEAEFEAIYYSNIKLEEKELEAFVESNVGFNVWPYWREYVQSTCCRVGFHPPIEIPLYLIEKEKTIKE